MLLWQWLVLCWLALLVGGSWITILVRDKDPERRRGLRAWALRRLPALAMVACSLVFGILGLSSQDPPASEDPTLLWIAIGTGAAGLVLGVWYRISPWMEEAD